MPGFIAVHVGAGYHAENLRPSYKKACKEACEAAVEVLRAKRNAVEAITAAVEKLEDSPVTNAGIGSNLNLAGEVECDAGIMDGGSLNFGSVGALSNIKNPIRVAQKILEEQNKGLLSCGRIPPCTLVGKGAVDWASQHGLDVTDGRQLSTKASRAVHLKNISLLQRSNNIVQNCSYNFISDIQEERTVNESTLLDTVGAVCIDSHGNVSSAVSSGGLLLKHPGRIGQAAVYGSGCWAQNSSSDKPSIACSVTGVGEYLIKTLFAKECYQTLYSDSDSISALPTVFRKKFLDSPCLKNVSSKLAGILTVKYYSEEDFCELSWAHTTKTMILGYMCVKDKKPYTVVSSQPSEAINGESIVGSEKCIKHL